MRHLNSYFEKYPEAGPRAHICKGRSHLILPYLKATDFFLKHTFTWSSI